MQNRKGKSGGGPRVAAVPPTGGSGGGPRVAAMPSQILPTGGPRVAGDKTDKVCSFNVGGPRVADDGSTCGRSYALTAKQERALFKGLRIIAWDKVPPSSDDGGGQEIRRISLGSARFEGGRALTPITNGHRKLVETINSIATAKTRDCPDLHWDCIQLVKAKQSDINCSIRYGEKYFALAAHGVQYAGKCSAANKQLDVADQGSCRYRRFH